MDWLEQYYSEKVKENEKTEIKDQESGRNDDVRYFKSPYPKRLSEKIRKILKDETIEVEEFENKNWGTSKSVRPLNLLLLLNTEMVSSEHVENFHHQLNSAKTTVINI